MRPLVLSCVLFALAAAARMAAAAATATTHADTKVASSLHGIESALETQDAARARQLTLDAVESWNTSLAGNPAQHAGALQKLARLLLDASLALEAELPLQRALAVSAAGTATDPSLADIHVMLTECYFGQDKLDRARHHQEEAIAIRRQHAFYEQPQSSEVGDDLYNLGYICLQLEDLEAADAAWRERLDLLRRVPVPDPGSIASGLSDLAEVNRRLGRYEQTESLMREAVATSESRGVLDQTHAVYLNNLALLCWDEDRFDEAERLLRDALRITEADSATTPLRLMRAHENLGVLGRDQGKMEQAERSLLQALDIGTTALGENDPSLVTVLNGLGILYNDLERWDEALAAWNRALAILASQPVPQEMDQAMILHFIGRGELARGNLDSARRNLERALEIRDRVLPPDHPELGLTLASLAAARAQAEGDTSSTARRLLARAIPVLEVTRASPRALAEAYGLRARSHWARGMADTALADMRSAVRIVEELRPQRGGGDETRARFLAEHVRYFNTLVDWLVAGNRLEEALGVAERMRSRVLQDQLAASHVDLRAGIPTEILAPLEMRERGARLRIHGLQQEISSLRTRDRPDSTSVAHLQELERHLDEALDAFRDANEEIKLSSPAWQKLLRGGHDSLAVRDIQEQLVARGSLLLVYHVGPEASFLFVVPPAPGKLECHRLEVPPAVGSSLGVEPGPLRDRVLRDLLLGTAPAGTAGSLAAGSAQASTGLMSQLRGVSRLEPVPEALPVEETRMQVTSRLHLLWQTIVPERAWKKVSNAREVVVIADASLHFLPFEALVTRPARAKKEPIYWLDAGPPIRYGHGIATLLDLAGRGHTTSDRSILTVSDPSFAPVAGDIAAPTREMRETLLPLPYTRRESEAIARSFPTRTITLLQGQDANETAVKNAAPHADWIHLATHGLVDESRSELLAALAFTPPAANTAAVDDGFLHLFEIYEMHLDCALAVLSACGTHHGRQIQGEGVFALSRGFLVAGARRIVASLWPVADESTAILMADFFARIARVESTGKPVQYAHLLHEAKRALRRTPQWSQPFYWAPFVLSGTR